MQTIFPSSHGRDFGLLTIGDPNLDRVFAVEKLPGSGEKRMARQLGVFGGGTSANVACAAGRLGVAASVFGRVGDDGDGMFLARSFQEFGVSTSYLRVSPGTPSSTAMIMVEPSGEKALLYAPIAAEPFDLPLLEEALARSRVVYVTPYDVAELETLSRLARQRQTCVAIDLEALVVPGLLELEAWLKLADLVFLNEEAFRSATGHAPTAESVGNLLHLGPAAIVVTLGSAGALAIAKAEFIDQAAFLAEVVDTTGAGDCFAAAFLAYCLEGHPLPDSVRFACAAASLAVTEVGARTGFPDRLTVDQLLVSQQPNRRRNNS